MGEVLCEHFNMEWARGKNLSDMKTKISHGHILYVEEGDATQASYYTKLMWQKAMKNESSLMKLHINTSAIFGDTNQIQDSSIQINIAKTKTLRHLKEIISRKISIPMDSFTISRQNVTRHFKDLDLTLMAHGLTSGALLKVMQGEARLEG